MDVSICVDWWLFISSQNSTRTPCPRISWRLLWIYHDLHTIAQSIAFIVDRNLATQSFALRTHFLCSHHAYRATHFTSHKKTPNILRRNHGLFLRDVAVPSIQH